MRRKCSRIEQVLWAGSPVPPMNYCLMVRLSGELPPETIQRAAQRLRRRFPTAFQRVLLDQNDAAWLESEGVPDTPLRVLDSCSDLDWQTVVQNELGVPFDLFIGPAFRLTLLHGPGFSDLVLTVQHAVADGLSGVYLLRSLLDNLADPSRPLEPPLDMPAMFAYVPDQVRSHPRVRLQNLMVKASMHFLRRDIRKSKASLQPSTAGQLPAWKRFKVLTASLDPNATQSLVASCKREGVSVHAAVSAAWIKASVETGIGSPKPVRKVSSPINLRERLSIPVGQTFGIYMSNILTATNCAPERDLWTIARELMEKLTRGSQGPGPFLWTLAMETSTLSLPTQDAADMFDYFSQKPVDYDFSISNLGRLDWPDRFGNYQVQAVYGPAVNTTVGEKTVGVVTHHGCIAFTFTLRDFVLDPQAARELMDLALENLALS